MKFTLEQKHKAELEKLASSGMTPVVIAQRAKILLMKGDGKSATDIAAELGVSRHTAELWIKKYRTRSEEDSIEDLLNVDKGRGRKEEITGEAKTWLISIACTLPRPGLQRLLHSISIRLLLKQVLTGVQPSRNPVCIGFWTSARSNHSASSIIASVGIRTSTKRCIMCC